MTTIYTVVLRVDKHDDFNDIVPGYDSEDCIEVWGIFTNREDAYAFRAECDKVYVERLKAYGRFSPYGHITFDVQIPRWDDSRSTEVGYNRVYNAQRAVLNYFPEDDDD
jgi:hypothetical protein